MWRNALDIFPGDWIETEHEEELSEEIQIGDRALVIIDFQFQDYYPDIECDVIRKCYLED